MTWLGGLGFFLFSLHATADLGRCNGMSLNLNPGSYNLSANASPTLGLQVQRNNINNGCDFFVTIDYGSATSAANRQLTNGSYSYAVQLYKDSGKSQVLKKIGDASSLSEVINGNFPDGSGSTSQNFSYFASLDPLLYNRFGTYSQTFNVNLYSGTLSEYRLEDTRTLSLQYIQGKNIDLSLVDTGAAFDRLDTTQNLNFGNLVAGASQSFDLIINYNAGFRLTVSSTNDGTLKHSLRPDAIGYSMTVSGNPLNLTSGPVTGPGVAGISPAGGLRLPVTVTIGSISGKSSGSYQDTVTFSVVSAE
jgi:spore coat protein U-like protein